VVEPSDNDGQPSGVSDRRTGGFPVVRACIVLALFVAATALILGEIHPTSTKSAPATAASTTAPTKSISTTTPTSTTRPTHSTHSTHSATTTTTIPPGRVSVLVANASGITGAAADISTELQASGWDMLPPVNASANVTSSNVYYVAGFQHQATSIAASLHLPPTAVAPYTTAAPISSIGTAEVVVVAGPDLGTSPTAASTTTTTAS
jgi:hypothetical protein